MMNKKFYVTAAIDYVNGAPHLGHALEKIQADVLARYHRSRGDDTFFLAGTDEHGTKIARAAEAAGKKPQEFVDENSEKFMALKEALTLSFDDFIRTTDRVRHWPAAVKLWRKLIEAGDIYKKNYRGFYCVGHEAFVTEKDLVGGMCQDHGKAPEAIEEENYFFQLSKYRDRILSSIENGELKILPETRKNEILSFIQEGLEDVSFSRPKKNLSWGIPVPDDDTQTMYVWADALTNYISAIGYGSFDEAGVPRESAQRFSMWWPADAHVIGKDILRFHAAIWPGMLLAAGLTLPRHILVHGFITVEGKKMSKTIGNVTDPVEIAKMYGADSLRYYLLREIPSGGDGDFSEAKFKALYNSDLANGLGNFTARVLALAEQSGVKLPLQQLADEAGIKNEIVQKIETIRAIVSQKIEEFKLHEALAAVWGLITFGDKYLNETTPWKIEDEEKRMEIVHNLLLVLEAVSDLAGPFLPSVSEKIKHAVVREGDTFRAEKIPPLFPRLEKET